MLFSQAMLRWLTACIYQGPVLGMVPEQRRAGSSGRFLCLILFYSEVAVW